MPRVDGTDPLSLQAVADLDRGAQLTAVEALGLTRDQAKKISQMRGLWGAVAQHLAPTLMERLRSLGFRGLALAPLARTGDWAGLAEILEFIDVQSIKREDLLRAPSLLAEKRARVAEVEQQMKARLSQLERQRAELQREEEALQQLKADLDRATAFLSPYPEPVRGFLAGHLGVDDQGQLCLARRLDYRSPFDGQISLDLCPKGSCFLDGHRPSLNSHLHRREFPSNWRYWGSAGECKQVSGGILVPIVVRAATWAVPLPNAQRQLLQQVTTG